MRWQVLHIPGDLTSAVMIWVACARVRKTGPPSHIHWLHVWSKQPQTSVRRGLQYRTIANDVKIRQKKENWSVWKCHSYENNHIKIKAFKQIMSISVRKRTFGHVRPVKIQSRLCGWAGRFESSLGAHVNYFFWHCDFYMVEGQFSISTAVPLPVTQIYLFKYIENFTIKNYKFSDKNSNIFFHISAQNIDCGYSLEPPCRDGSNEYHNLCFWTEIRKNNVFPCKPQFYYIKVGFKGVKII